MPKTVYFQNAKTRTEARAAKARKKRYHLTIESYWGLTFHHYSNSILWLRFVALCDAGSEDIVTIIDQRADS